MCRSHGGAAHGCGGGMPVPTPVPHYPRPVIHTSVMYTKGAADTPAPATAAGLGAGGMRGAPEAAAAVAVAFCPFFWMTLVTPGTTVAPAEEGPFSTTAVDMLREPSPPAVVLFFTAQPPPTPPSAGPLAAEGVGGFPTLAFAFAFAAFAVRSRALFRPSASFGRVALMRSKKVGASGPQGWLNICG